MDKILRTTENKILAFLSLAIGFNTLFFIAREVKPISFLIITRNTDIFYLIYAVLAVCVSGTIFFFTEGWQWRRWLAKKLLVLFPTELLLLFAITESNQFHYIFQIASGFYIIMVGIMLIDIYHSKNESAPERIGPAHTRKSWLSIQKRSTLAILTLLIAVNLGFGSYRIAQFAAVDEALWTFGGRIARYWSNFAERDWKGTKVSDKPGVTVSIISGAGLLFEIPKDYKPVKRENGTYRPKNDIQKLNFALRFPILLFTALMLPAFYFFLERLLGERKSLLSTILIGTSPILLGMSRIINPDSLLWVFAPLAMISYFVFLKRKRLAYLYWAGIFLGLALLTKYVANILFVFFFSLIFLEYILMEKEARKSIDFIVYIKNSFLNYAILTFAALAVFYILYPLAWVKPTTLLDATLLSQAFESTWPLFVGIISFIFIDQWTMRNRITKALLDTIADKKHWLISILASLFLGSVLFALANTLTGMQWYDFEEILASPKTSYGTAGFPGILLGNFYPLVFGIHPMALCALVIFSIFLIRHAALASSTYRSGFYLIVFVLLYYFGATVNHVATISRYQIILFPIALILAGIALAILLEMLRKKIPRLTFGLGASLILLAGTSSLAFSTPLYSGYASALLPSEYYLDIKDMGDGSYEAADFLNRNLPDAAHASIWSDKNGVCTFFIGNCYTSFNFKNLRGKDIDYVVVSSGRRSRTFNRVNPDKIGVIRFDLYYARTDNLIYSQHIDNRPGNFVKIFPFVKD